jgi:transcriptional regulator with XRE-family HTH domain
MHICWARTQIDLSSACDVQQTLAAKFAHPAGACVYNLILLTNILRILDDIGMTKSELAKKAGMSVSFLSDLTNDQANPSLRIMEAIAHALDTPLPALLETTDLDRQTLEELAGGKSRLSLPEGYARVAAILTEFQAFTVRQWDQENRKRLDAAKARRKSMPGKKT